MTTKKKAAKKKTAIKKPAVVVYTYIGSGEDSPQLIDFMGLQRFVRGQATEVTNKTVLSKIVGNACFVSGEVNTDILFDIDEAARKIADGKRNEDISTQIEFERQNKK